MLRSTLLAAARSPRLRAIAETGRLAAPVVGRFVAGADVEDAVAVAAELAVDRLVTVDHLGEDAVDRDRVERAVDAYRVLLGRVREEGLADRVEVSVKLSALGQRLATDGDAIALDAARLVCEAAAAAGTTMTVDMENHSTTDRTLAAVRALRVDFPWVGAVLQAALRRTEGDCRDLAGAGSRIRLCKGAYDEPESAAYRTRPEVDRSFARCLHILAGGAGLPMVATHDPRLIVLARRLCADRPFEIQMLHGVRPAEQVALAAEGTPLRVYLPYGTEWYGYFMRRLAERPANLAFFARSLLSRG